MFWRLGFGHTSPLETLLDSDNYTLQQLLDEDDLIQECKQLNKKLIDFLALPEQVEALIDYVVRDAPADGDEKSKFVYPYKASEVLSADLSGVVDCVFQSEALLDKLFNFLNKDPPLNPLLAGYFGKIISVFLSRRPEQTLQILHNRNIVPLLLNHLGASSILDLLLKIIQEAEDAMEPASTEWIYQMDLVGKLITKLDPSLDSEIHANASSALVSFVAPPAPPPLSWPSTPPAHRSRFAGQLLAREAFAALLEKVLKGSSSTLQHGLTVIVEIVRHCVTSNRQSTEIQPLISLILEHLKDFVEILKSPPPIPAVQNTSGLLDPPLGSNRLKILEVLVALLTLKDDSIEAEVIRLKMLPVCLDLFFRYEWHSFLHNLVKNLLFMILEGESKALKQSLFTDCTLLERIVDAHKLNDEALKQPKSCRKGYMGQLRLVSNLVNKQKTKDTWMEEYTGQPLWKDFVQNQLEPLNDVNERRNVGGGSSRQISQGQSDEEEDFHGGNSKEDGLGSGSFEFRVPDNSGELFSPDRDDYADLESGGDHFADTEADEGEQASDGRAVEDLSNSMSKLKVTGSSGEEVEADKTKKQSERVVLTITLEDGPTTRARVILTPV
mmetsp:Transcript_67685/g.180946  ORF Transcript_67685/g.180946 Transcript_67685/m.180946 type:complete len:611 (+) Transcript_67685:329-2161(+)|eukprot:CAMPEP_0113673242 /NCGR_PEP_ID=MMETSP0038_2-20120614/6743_1 /TAXON_ID=2898 /ORGANISM="Cryptomonas paramecium" /LENGTH=610 /DNA_ID=CAMNT_0000589667 /DNA_START=454 /DNA_END=2286 /DNA_ORIENTATION=- /assembly_acc=CAM_ASM_000170